MERTQLIDLEVSFSLPDDFPPEHLSYKVPSNDPEQYYPNYRNLATEKIVKIKGFKKITLGHRTWASFIITKHFYKEIRRIRKEINSVLKWVEANETNNFHME